MNCPQCQTTNDSRSAFCSNCGTSLAAPDSRIKAAPSPGYGPAGPAGAPGLPGTPVSPDLPSAPYTPAAPAPASTFHLDLHRLSRVDQTVAGASLLVFIALFLPWFGISVLGGSFSISGMTAHGYLAIVLILAVVLICYVLLRSGWAEFPVNLPIAHAPLLLIGTGLQFLLVLIGFLDKPAAGLSWEFGAYLALLGAAGAAAPVVIPAVRSWQESR